jgi:Alr-MurF fusion protein
VNYPLQHIAQIISAEISGTVAVNARVERIFIDSRMYLPAAGSLFFAISGERHRAVQYIPELIDRGFRWFVTDREVPPMANPPADMVVLRVSNVLAALQQLAAHHRATFNYPVIGITGSNGKTIVKEWLFQMTQQRFQTVRSPRSYNSQVGVPLSIFGMNENHRLAIMEAGISQPHEMENLAKMINPDIGIFTNIGQAHDANFSSRDDKIAEKLRLFQHCKVLIYCLDHYFLWQFLKASGPYSTSWSVKEKADICFSPPATPPVPTATLPDQPVLGGKTCYPKENKWKATYLDKEIYFKLPFTEPMLVENALHCVATCLVLGMDEAEIAAQSERLESIPMRLEVKQLPRNLVLVNDSYNSDLKSLELALNYLGQNNPHKDAVVILSDVLQTGISPPALYAKVAEMIKVAGVKRVISVGVESEELQSLLPKFIDHSHFATTDDLLQAHQLESLQNCGILLKGARNFEFERLARILEERQHDTLLEINLENLVHNLNVYRALLSEGVSMMAMMKASAYGAGSEQLARVLQHEKVDYLAVAYADEGVALRRAGIHLPIVVLQPQPAVFELMLRYALEPEIYDLPLLQSWLRFVHSNKDGAETIPGIHLKLDTGMHRLGFKSNDLDQLISELQQHPEIEIISIFSHLSAADNREHSDFTRLQINRFEESYAQICSALNIKPLRHMLNSSGLANYPEASMDLIRLGIGLYGIDPSGSIKSQLLPVASLKARILQVKTVPANEPVGYNFEGQAPNERKIAIISAGYADGLPRSLSTAGYEVLLHHQPARIIGSVCMDVCMIDISAIPEAQAGDEVEIFGTHRPIEDFARAAGQIPYEVLTGISSRVRRSYFW